MTLEDLTELHFDALYEYFVDRGIMPYGAAKARDQDPKSWITDFLATMGDDDARLFIHAVARGTPAPRHFDTWLMINSHVSLDTSVMINSHVSLDTSAPRHFDHGR